MTDLDPLFLGTSVVFIFIAAAMLFLALKTFICRRPFLMSARWFFGFICLSFLPSIAISVRLGFSRPSGLITVGWMNPLITSMVLLFFWIQLKGYVAFAVSHITFRDALLASVKSLGYSTEETMSCLKIKETGQEIEVAIQGWVGTAQLKSQGTPANDTLKRIAKEMTYYFQEIPGKINYFPSYFCLILGAIMAVISGWVLTLAIP